MIFFRQLQRELLINLRQPRVIINSTLFFLMICAFFPLGMPANKAILQQFAPGLIWIAALFALLLASERLLQQDYDDGVLEQWAISSYPLYSLILSKLFVHWLLIVVPILLLCPLLTVLFDLPWTVLANLLLGLLCGTPTLLSLCALAAAFGLGMQQKGVLMALIVLPLTLPILIFGSGIVNLVLQGIAVSGYFALLSAFSLLAFGLLPFAIAAVIRISLTQ